MIGNAWEVTQDCWNPNYSGAPADGSVWTSGDCSMRVNRGGTFQYDSWYMRSAFRVRGPIAFGADNHGLRVARDLP